MTIDAITNGEQGSSVRSKLNTAFTAINALTEIPTVYDLGATGDGSTDDLTALQNAITDIDGVKYLDLGNNPEAVFLVSGQVLSTNTAAVVIRGKGTIKRADGVIVNTDADNTNYTPIIRIAGAPFVEFSGGWGIDGNRDGQTYPATSSTVGRGSIPFRHNAEIEICPSTDNTTQSQNIHIENISFKNAYINSIVFWQCKGVKVLESQFKNTTWNGIAGSGCTDVVIQDSNFYRCGASDSFPTTQRQGDRAGLQFREFPNNMTQGTEGIPCIITGEYSNGGINQGIRVQGGYFEECGVESVYIRAAFNSSCKDIFSKNCGYKRLSSATYLPAHIWLENGEYICTGNHVFQTQVIAGDHTPDGLRITSLVGDAASIFPANGTYYCQVHNNHIVSDKSSGTTQGLLNYGIRTNGHGDYSSNVVDGTLDYSIWVQNDNSFTGDSPPRDFRADGCTLLNSDMGANGNAGLIHVTLFGSPVGDVENISAKGVTTNESLEVIEINNNLSGYTQTNISYGTGNIFSRYSQVGPITITSALKRQDNHNLDGFPKLVTGTIKCLANNGGWQTGDEVDVSYLITTGNNQGMAISADSVRTTVLIGSDASPLKLPNRAAGSEGNTVSLDLTKWELYIKCFI